MTENTSLYPLRPPSPPPAPGLLPPRLLPPLIIHYNKDVALVVMSLPGACKLLSVIGKIVSVQRSGFTLSVLIT